MDRLTGYIDGGIVLARRLIGDTDWLHAVLDRLASYEDSGIPPERVQELAAAEREGRLIVIPQSRACRECELGDRHAPLIECSA